MGQNKRFQHFGLQIFFLDVPIIKDICEECMGENLWVYGRQLVSSVICYVYNIMLVFQYSMSLLQNNCGISISLVIGWGYYNVLQPSRKNYRNFIISMTIFWNLIPLDLLLLAGSCYVPVWNQRCALSNRPYIIQWLEYYNWFIWNAYGIRTGWKSAPRNIYWRNVNQKCELNIENYFEL